MTIFWRTLRKQRHSRNWKQTANKPARTWPFRLTCFAWSIALVIFVVPSQAFSALPAFPGAEGSGALAKGGRGGNICAVTNLNDSGPGSLRSCVDMSGPRMVIFRVSGNIVLKSRLRIRNPYITIAGQTAPGGGIQITGKEPGSIPYKGEDGPVYEMGDALIWVETHDVIIRYLRLRIGYVGHCPSCPGTGIGEPILIGSMSSGSWQDHVENVILDHISSMWGGNLNLRIWDMVGHRRVKNISVQNSIFAETLYGRPQMTIGSSKSFETSGSQMGDIDLHRNLLSTAFGRTPLITGTGFPGNFRYINNISYNTTNTMARIGENVPYEMFLDYVGNIFDHGPVFDSSSRGAYEIAVSVNDPPAKVYVAGNRGDRNGYDNYNMLGRVSSGGGSDVGNPPASDDYRKDVPNPDPRVPISIVHVDALEEHILPNVGASRRLDCEGNWVFNRDAADTRVIEEGYKKRTQNFLVTHEDQVGGFPVLGRGQLCADSSGDGIPDAWMTRNSLNPQDAIGSRFHESGYTFLELYLNGMQVNAQSQVAPAAAPSGVLVH